MIDTRVIGAFGKADARGVGRDPMLRWMLLLPLGLALGVRWLFPIVLDRLGEFFKMDVMAYYHVIAAYSLLLITPILYGIVVGSLFLDQRDDGTLTALRVTPVPLRGFLAYRLALPMLISWVMTLVAFGVAGVSDISFPWLALCAAVATPVAALAALALAAFAENKVQGIALQKAGSVFMLPPLVAYFVPSGWQLLFGVLPTFWPTRLYTALQEGDPAWWGYLLGGVLYQALLISLLLRRFERVTSR